MCIIAIKKSGIKAPNMDTIRTMFTNNPDGAGIMYPHNGVLVIDKGFMTSKAFMARLEKLETEIDTTTTPIVYHFRISTSGGIRPENCHPFPVTESIKAMQKPAARCNVGIAHNGVIYSVSPRKTTISDTMEYILAQIAPLSKMSAQWYKNKHALRLVQNAINGSRLAIMDASGYIAIIGEYVTVDGILYSNDSYKPRKYSGMYGSWMDDEYSYDAQYKKLMFLDDAKHVVLNAVGELVDTFDFLIDDKYNVYAYDYRMDYAFQCVGFRVLSTNSKPVKYDADSADYIEVI